jgi:LysR family transcriptional regulator, mexEF-oprN operon transcriptional activator
VFVAQQDDIQGCIGSILTGAGYHLDIVLGVPEYLTALAAAVSSPLLVTLPMPIARRYVSFFNLETQKAPVDVELPPVSLIWAKRSNSDAAAMWLRDQIVAICHSKQNHPSDVTPSHALSLAM